jgi:hypothetical protein
MPANPTSGLPARRPTTPPAGSVSPPGAAPTSLTTLPMIPTGPGLPDTTMRRAEVWQFVLHALLAGLPLPVAFAAVGTVRHAWAQVAAVQDVTAWARHLGVENLDVHVYEDDRDGVRRRHTHTTVTTRLPGGTCLDVYHLHTEHLPADPDAGFPGLAVPDGEGRGRG